MEGQSSQARSGAEGGRKSSSATPEAPTNGPKRKRRSSPGAGEDGAPRPKRPNLLADEERPRPSFDSLPDLVSEPVPARTEAVFSERRFDDEARLHPFLRRLLTEKMGLRAMTEVQEKCLDPLLEGRDALIKAQTGSGKTLAFAVPMVQRLQEQDPAITRETGPVALVLCPTRELVLQTQAVFQQLLRPFVRIVSGGLTGGVSRKGEKASLRKGINVLVATPQRLLDHVRSTRRLRLSSLRWLVVDEADRLLETGFERAVRQVLDAVREARPEDADPPQTALLSATLSAGVERLAGLALNRPVLVSATGLDAVALPAGLRHFLLCPPAKLRLVALAAFLLLKCRYSSSAGKVIVFLATQDAVDFHHALLSATIAGASDDLALPGIATELELFRLHGSMEHQERQAVFRRFSSCSAGGVLLTTDVACRGLDLPRVSWVVQYHVPGRPVDYVHRVGRTARAGGRGKALLFLQPQEREYERVLAGLGVRLEELPLDGVLQTALVHVNNSRGRGGGGKARRLIRSADEAAARLQRGFERHVATCGDETRALAEQAFLSFLRFYASFSGDMRDIFRFKALHLGHAARSFALREAPRDIARRVTGRVAAPVRRGAQQVAEAEQNPRLDHQAASRNLLAEFGL